MNESKGNDELEKKEMMGFSFDLRWFCDIYKHKTYEELSEKYQNVIQSIIIIKNDKNIILKNFIEIHKLEHMIREKPNQIIKQYFSKIKVNSEALNKQTMNFFLTIKENDDDNSIIIDCLMKKKNNESYSENKVKINSLLENEIKENIFKELIYKNITSN